MQLYDIPLTTIDGTTTTLAPYKGRVMLIVNVASACGFTPQYAGLERLYRTYDAYGFVVLGFPCNQFGRQEPGDEAEIAAFCAEAYDVTFPMFAKIDVKGPHAHPLFQHLTRVRSGLLGSRVIKWNFTKFLVDRDGAVRQRYAPVTTPEKLEQDITGLLATTDRGVEIR